MCERAREIERERDIAKREWKKGKLKIRPTRKEEKKSDEEKGKESSSLLRFSIFGKLKNKKTEMKFIVFGK